MLELTHCELAGLNDAPRIDVLNVTGNCTVYVGDCVESLRTMPDKSVHCCVTSPPYWGLRDYGTARWEGGSADCDHKNGPLASSKSTLRGYTADSKLATGWKPYRDTCGKCGAIRIDSQLGLEKTPEEYVAKMVEVFREVRRVLKDDGTLWLNLGDSYAANRSYQVGSTKGGKKHSPAQGDLGASTVPDGLKPKDLVGIPWRVAFALQADGFYLRQDIIWAKCLSGGTVVYARTQKGEMPMSVKDIVRLDPSTVKLWDGSKWNQAVSWEKSPAKGDGLEFELRNGQRIGCTPEHRWPTARGILAASDIQVGDVIASCVLPEPESPRIPDGLPPDDIGWFVGLYIAEGSQSDGTIQIASHASETERFARICKIAGAYDGYAAMHSTGGNGATINVNSPVLLGVINAYVSGRTAHDKHLGPRCWKRDNRFLRSLLEGYLSGDGHLANGGRWRLGFCDNDALASDFRVLSARIGASLRLRRTKHVLKGASFPGWRGSLYFDSSRRKQSDFEVVCIRSSRARVFWDISLRDEPHTFALGCGVLTHNSNPMPESVTDRCTKSHEYIFLMSKSAKYWYDADAVKEASVDPEASAKRYAAPFFVGDKHESGNYSPTGATHTGGMKHFDGTRNRRSVWHISTRPYKGAHFATFPPALIEPCIKAGCPEGGTVLDPFGGSGTTGRVASDLGRKAILCELNTSYIELIKQRLTEPAKPLKKRTRDRLARGVEGADQK